MADGVKYDEGKPLPGDLITIFNHGIIMISNLIAIGAKKYPEIDNWKRVKDGKRRYTNALMRHLLQHLSGDEIDKETGLPHIASVAWNALAVLELYLMDREKDVK